MRLVNVVSWHSVVMVPLWPGVMEGGKYLTYCRGVGAGGHLPPLPLFEEGGHGPPTILQCTGMAQTPKYTMCSMS